MKEGPEGEMRAFFVKPTDVNLLLEVSSFGQKRFIISRNFMESAKWSAGVCVKKICTTTVLPSRFQIQRKQETVNILREPA